MILFLLACFEEPPIEVKTDRAALVRNVAVPEGWEDVRWAGRPLGSPGLGPTDLVVVAVFQGADTSGLERTGDRAVLVDPVLAEKLGLPDSLPGDRYDTTSLTTPMWDANFVIASDQGVVVQWYSR
ncbi:MAG: hypothetical protein GY913_29970 [Proteobacteria bacterium]|nr:hypothetical protein [Pseudomonadota bacterium]MCP4921144.1 hypothetical protein [Pseudomonadota bacterium]